VGCGTGAVLSEYQPTVGGSITGIDLDLERLIFFHKNSSFAYLAAADGFTLPFAPGEFDQCFCHYFLLWLKEPLLAILEIKRVLKKGGQFFIFSEPDYGGRIEHPLEFEFIKDTQIKGLVRQGADPYMGRKIFSLLHEAGFKSIQTGILTWSSGMPTSEEELESEWEIFALDSAGEFSPASISELKSLDRKSRREIKRILYLPVFFGWGSV
jgi:SAM-dependent methyltransferase